ncbi:hypothetical protein NG99_03445 [Erwinia typographi]|uniref:Uncharacterized protein n=1 Tax=Erwinia typographi TaxID=371042 RepID=A0A0A3ZCM4_9GAMM|nr:hypothetical protein [Erwinia typographi]KGT95401.1 hypothetical protein NG99_03445 [Erwinia typographi]
MKAGEVFKLLAKGIHPETGELIPGGSVVHLPEAIRLLYSLAEEFADDIFPQIKRKEKVKLTPDQRREKNRAEGRPANAYLAWGEEEKGRLLEDFQNGIGILYLGELYERSPRSIALQLEKMSLITPEEAAAYD